MSSPLSPDQWRQIESLIDALLDTPPERRAALFAKVSGGDHARQAELERVVAACERTYPLLEQPAAERFAALVDPGPLQPSHIVADRYRTTREIGRGGMATVYLAHDLKHARDVALKVVRAELAATVGTKRFLREIEIAAQLRHPNIVPLFDSGETTTSDITPAGQQTADAILYYVMPYEAGQSLRERLRRERRLSVDDTLVVLRDVCEALAHAHAHGVVHRDIKPDNILLSGRRALVSDFGIARAAAEATDGGASAGTGILIGTPTYMAPEQVEADPRVDHRADIYAVGVLAYELLTGRPPFSASSPQEMLTAQLAEVPPALSTIRADVPNVVADLIMKCLAKKPADRWQTVEEMLRALDAPTQPIAAPALPDAQPQWRRWGARLVPATILAAAAVMLVVTYAAPGRRPDSVISDPRLAIAILPVTAASAGGELDWLASGLQTRLSAELADVPAFDVRPTAMIQSLLRADWPLDRVALEREVDYFVQAGVSKGMGDSVLVTLELIERGLRIVRVGDVRLYRPVETTVEELGRRLAERLRPMLGSRARERELERGATNAEAYRLRRQADHQRVVARGLLAKEDARGVERALDSTAALLIASERLDPTWNAPRLARASLAATRAMGLSQRSRGTDTTGVRRVIDAGIALLDSVLRRTPRDAAARALRGRLRWQSTLLPHGPSLHVVEVSDLARRDLEAALAIDTTLAQAAADLSQVYFEAYARYDDAAASAARAYRIDSFMEGASQIISRLALSHFEMRRDELAAWWCREGMRRFPENPAHISCALEVMAWGTGPANADSAWAHYRRLEPLVGKSNPSARPFYQAEVAAVLARSSAALGDSARRLLARTARDVGGESQSVRDDHLPVQAGVLFRLGDSARAGELIAQLRRRDSVRANLVSQRRMLRDYITPAPERPTR